MARRQRHWRAGTLGRAGALLSGAVIAGREWQQDPSTSRRLQPRIQLDTRLESRGDRATACRVGAIQSNRLSINDDRQVTLDNGENSIVPGAYRPVTTARGVSDHNPVLGMASSCVVRQAAHHRVSREKLALAISHDCSR